MKKSQKVFKGMIKHTQVFLCRIKQLFSKLRPSGPMLPISRFVRVWVYLFTFCGLNVFFSPFRSQMFKSYETLQACASISVPKLCNFHLQYLVNFVKKN